jgi:hypothetical protein
MEKATVTPVSQYASWVTPESSNMLTTEAEPLVTLPTDEINIEKAAEIDAVIGGQGTMTHQDGTSEPITVFPYPADKQKELVQQSISTLKELTNSPEVKKALESEGLTVDYAAINQSWNDGTGFKVPEATPVAMEPETEEVVACACTDCAEDVENDMDTDTMLIVHDLSERFAALEARIAAFNVKASHKI